MVMYHLFVTVNNDTHLLTSAYTLSEIQRAINNLPKNLPGVNQARLTCFDSDGVDHTKQLSFVTDFPKCK